MKYEAKHSEWHDLWYVDMDDGYRTGFFGKHAEADAKEYAAKLNERARPLFFVSTTSAVSTMDWMVMDRIDERAAAFFMTESHAQYFCDWLNSQEPS